MNKQQTQALETIKNIMAHERISREWCIYSRLTREEKDTVNRIVYACLERNGFDPEDPWWQMSYQLSETALNK